MKKIFFSLIFTALILSFVGSKTNAQSQNQLTQKNKNSDLEIILDCSGSMAEMIEGQTKMEIAKKALKTIIDEIPADSQVGFRAYGHQSSREAKDCTDSELIYPIEKINKDNLVNKIKSLEPKGWTPIEYSLLQAKNDFPTVSETNKMIILVSDGEETCGGDPCQAVKKLKEEGFNFVINTIGFKVGDLAEEQLKCIAETSGGEYKTAKNATELTESLRIFSLRAFEEYQTFEKIKAGNGFVNAPLIDPGNYGGDILIEENKFYKLKAQKGQEISVTLNIKKEQVLEIEDHVNCACMLPSLKIYNSNQKIVAQDNAKNCRPEGKGIPPADISLNSYTASSKIEETGEIYVSVTNNWQEACDELTPNAYLKRIAKERDEKRDKKQKALYDLNILIEGEEVPTKTNQSQEDQTNANLDNNNQNLNQSSQNQQTLNSDPSNQKEQTKSTNLGLILIITLPIIGLLFLIIIVLVILLLVKKNKTK
jgi:hypothetical protein